MGRDAAGVRLEWGRVGKAELGGQVVPGDGGELGREKTFAIVQCEGLAGRAEQGTQLLEVVHSVEDDQDAAAGTGDAAELPDGDRRVGDVVEHVRREGHVDRVVAQWEVTGVSGGVSKNTRWWCR